jgi:hypothetical protein
MRWKLNAVGARKKVRQWTEYDETDAKKIGRIVKIKTHKTNRKEQYREILKQIQGNPEKQNTKENQNKK